MERWVGSCRWELLDHVIVLNERHLRRLMREYVSYYQDRVHDSLGKETPYKRAAIEQKPAASATVIGMPRSGGLHHRYAWRVAA